MKTDQEPTNIYISNKNDQESTKEPIDWSLPAGTDQKPTKFRTRTNIMEMD